MQGPLTKILENEKFLVYEVEEESLFGKSHFYYIAFRESPLKIMGPFASVVQATGYYDELQKEIAARPNVVHVNFQEKKRMAGTPPDYAPAFIECKCGMHYDCSLRSVCPHCGNHPLVGR